MNAINVCRDIILPMGLAVALVCATAAVTLALLPPN